MQMLMRAVSALLAAAAVGPTAHAAGAKAGTDTLTAMSMSSLTVGGLCGAEAGACCADNFCHGAANVCSDGLCVPCGTLDLPVCSGSLHSDIARLDRASSCADPLPQLTPSHATGL